MIPPWIRNAASGQAATTRFPVTGRLKHRKPEGNVRFAPQRQSLRLKQKRSSSGNSAPLQKHCCGIRPETENRRGEKAWVLGSRGVRSCGFRRHLPAKAPTRQRGKAGLCRRSLPACLDEHCSMTCRHSLTVLCVCIRRSPKNVTRGDCSRPRGAGNPRTRRVHPHRLSLQAALAVPHRSVTLTGSVLRRAATIQPVARHAAASGAPADRGLFYRCAP